MTRKKRLEDQLLPSGDLKGAEAEGARNRGGQSGENSDSGVVRQVREYTGKDERGSDGEGVEDGGCSKRRWVEKESGGK